MEQGEKRGWVRYIGTRLGTDFRTRQIYPCLITERGFIKLPERCGDYLFHPGIVFEIIEDPFLTNIDKILE